MQMYPVNLEMTNEKGDYNSRLNYIQIQNIKEHIIM